MVRSRAWAWFLPVLALSCSSSLGNEGLDVLPEGVTAPIPCADPDDPRPSAACPELATVMPETAKALVADLATVAAAAHGADVRWTGRVAGRDIARTGKPTTGATAGWATGFCHGADALAFDVTGGACGARNLCDCATAGTCGGAACTGDTAPAFPAVDSDAAIAAAFPGDAAAATYDLDFDAPAGQWTVTRRADGTRVLVDAATGIAL